MDHEGRSFKGAESIYHVWITKEEVLKVGVHISCVDHQRRTFKVGQSIYHVWFTKEEVLKLRSL